MDTTSDVPRSQNPMSSGAAEAADALKVFKEDAAALLSARESTLSGLKVLQKDLFAQYIGVNITKTASAVAAVAAVPLMFLFPPAGVGCAIASGATGVGAALGDFITDKVHSGTFKQVMDADECARKKFEESTQNLAAAFANLNASHGTMLQEIWSYLTSVGSAAYGSYSTFSTAMTLVNIVKITRAVQQLDNVAIATVRVGTGLGATAKALGLGTRGLKSVTVTTMESGAAGSKVATQVVASTAAKALAGVAAVVSVVDCVWSWAADSDLKKKVKECVDIVQRSVNDLREITEM